MTVPSKFREDLGDKFYVCRGLDGCLFLLSQSQWDSLVEKVAAIPLAQGKGIQRYFFSGAAGAYFTIAVDCFTDLRYCKEEWVTGD